MPASAAFAGSPLVSTVDLLHSIEPEMNAVHLGLPEEDGWTVCAALAGNPEVVANWEAALCDHLATIYDATPAALATTAAACVLDAVAYPAAFLVGASFHVARRVPDVSADRVAFRVDPNEHWISGSALLDDRFWCLPDDPAAGGPAATVVADLDALADRARQLVRAHADDILRSYDTAGVAAGARMAAFVDALDAAPWIAHTLPSPTTCLDTSSILLPGRAPHLDARTRLSLLDDERGRTHITRRRQYCCKSHLIEPDRSACMDCVRTSDDERVRIATGLPDPPAIHTSETAPS